ncbi:sirohydrochlorin chelatase [Halovenus sp. WSH3]|uniref:Sirohydrochlorin chelatase n=1 Tax=Halovenus carboxidivorans TaxID=2692199 RepID=A0A6B0T486_9EURY|nr:CbiX/SirB N-terminal domain-containing protein [Halovenus carboxidivorans]MXR50021.1 sirohydrochlorin chelatase [Halovenus carboxidivorans]
MTTESIVLVGRERADSARLFETHADRLRERSGVDAVETATYETEPVQELRGQLRELSADRVYAVPMRIAHSHATTRGVPAALSHVSGEVVYCEPPGRSAAVTDVVEQKAGEVVPARSDATLVLVGFGSNSQPEHRRTTERHAERLRERTEYGEIVSCYLLQNPAVECVRYNVSNPSAVAVPLFLGESEATAEQIPTELELGRGGLEYTGPLAGHPRITDAIHAEVEKRRTLGNAGEEFEAKLTRTQQPVATDGDGHSRS